MKITVCDFCIESGDLVESEGQCESCKRDFCENCSGDVEFCAECLPPDEDDLKSEEVQE